jgi:hypothetical protein
LDAYMLTYIEAGLSVLKGAVLFGHKPDYIASRVMRFSYGTDVTRLFDPKCHEQHRKYTCKLSGEIRCLGLFGEIIRWFLFLGRIHVNIHFSLVWFSGIITTTDFSSECNGFI